MVKYKLNFSRAVRHAVIFLIIVICNYLLVIIYIY